MTCLFILAAIAGAGARLDRIRTHARSAPITGSASPALVAVILAFPVAMALATGTEAPATSIAQLGQLDDRGRARFGRGTLALTIVIVGGLTLGADRAGRSPARRHPARRQTQIAELAHTAVGGGGLFGFFQLTSGLLLLAAASSSFQAGPGLLKALARTGPSGEDRPPAARGSRRTNKHHTPVAAVVVYAADLRGDHPRRQRPGTGAGARLRGRGLRQLPRRPARHGALLDPPRRPRPRAHEPPRRGRSSRSRWSSTSPAATHCSRSPAPSSSPASSTGAGSAPGDQSASKRSNATPKPTSKQSFAGPATPRLRMTYRRPLTCAALSRPAQIRSVATP